MATSKYVFAVGMIVIAAVAFGVGLVTSPIILPQLAPVTDAVWDRISRTGIIKAGTDPSWPPYESLDNVTGQIVGFEIDLMNAVASKLGKTVEWHAVGFDTILPSIQSGELDMGVSGFSITKARLAVVQFTMPHSTTRGQIIMLKARRDALGITMMTSLTNITTLGLTVGTQQGTTEQEELIGAGIASAKIRAFNDYGAAITDMAGAVPTVDCVYAETPITSSWIAQYQTLGKEIVVVYDIPYYPVAFMANKDAHTFLAKVDGALADIIASGELDALREEWHA